MTSWQKLETGIGVAAWVLEKLEKPMEGWDKRLEFLFLIKLFLKKGWIFDVSESILNVCEMYWKR